MDARLAQKYAVPLDTYAANIEEARDVRLRMQELRRKYEQAENRLHDDVSRAKLVQENMRALREKIENLELEHAEEQRFVAAYDENKLESVRQRASYVVEGGRGADEKKATAELISEVFRAWKAYWQSACDVGDRKYKNVLRWKLFCDKLLDEEHRRRETVMMFEEKRRTRLSTYSQVAKEQEACSEASRPTQTPFSDPFSDPRSAQTPFSDPRSSPDGPPTMFPRGSPDSLAGFWTG
jgi:hypothetical protein